MERLRHTLRELPWCGTSLGYSQNHRLQKRRWARRRIDGSHTCRPHGASDVRVFVFGGNRRWIPRLLSAAWCMHECVMSVWAALPEVPPETRMGPGRHFQKLEKQCRICLATFCATLCQNPITVQGPCIHSNCRGSPAFEVCLALSLQSVAACSSPSRSACPPLQADREGLRQQSSEIQSAHVDHQSKEVRAHRELATSLASALRPAGAAIHRHERVVAEKSVEALGVYLLVRDGGLLRNQNSTPRRPPYLVQRDCVAAHAQHARQHRGFDWVDRSAPLPGGPHTGQQLQEPQLRTLVLSQDLGHSGQAPHRFAKHLNLLTKVLRVGPSWPCHVGVRLRSDLAAPCSVLAALGPFRAGRVPFWPSWAPSSLATFRIGRVGRVGVPVPAFRVARVGLWAPCPKGQHGQSGMRKPANKEGAQHGQTEHGPLGRGPTRSARNSARPTRTVDGPQPGTASTD